MSHKVRFIMVGGFLGAGKTTTLARLARHFMDGGRSVGIVTNDQATDLVDTNAFRSQGFDVGEVAGACFCCNFDELLDTIQSLGIEQAPDVILAEPVGSCTDLVATVIQPLRRLYTTNVQNLRVADKIRVRSGKKPVVATTNRPRRETSFSIAPYCVILKPSHGRRILRNEQGAGFSPKAAYILKKQLEEADAILINRIDELATEQLDELVELVETHHPGRPLLRISAKTGEGFESLCELLDQQGDFGRRILDIDYDIYADGEAELGWLNSSLRITAETAFSLDEFLLEIVASLRNSLAQAEAETAHLKVIGLWEGFFGVANLISSENQPELSLPSHCAVKVVDLIINARVACDPAILETHVKAAVSAAGKARGARVEFRRTQSFRPGRPVPTHRYDTTE